MSQIVTKWKIKNKNKQISRRMKSDWRMQIPPTIYSLSIVGVASAKNVSQDAVGVLSIQNFKLSVDGRPDDG